MVSQGVVDDILRLLAEGQLSQRKIARSVGVSRGTIGAIAKGHRPRIRTTEERWADPTRPLGPPRRCPGCGGLVYMPCLLCRVRSLKAADSSRRGSGLVHARSLKSIDGDSAMTKKSDHNGQTPRGCHSFTLILSGFNEITSEVENKLFDAGCSDATLGIREGAPYLAFDREADSLADAINSATADVNNSGLGIGVARVATDEDARAC